jgi:hypothetical protein
MRLPNFHSDVDADNYSPQVEKLLMEWERDRAPVTTREAPAKKMNRRTPNRRRTAPPKMTRSVLSTA